MKEIAKQGLKVEQLDSNLTQCESKSDAYRLAATQKDTAIEKLQSQVVIGNMQQKEKDVQINSQNNKIDLLNGALKKERMKGIGFGTGFGISFALNVAAVIYILAK